jgi:hypothetical protein
MIDLKISFFPSLFALIVELCQCVSYSEAERNDDLSVIDALCLKEKLTPKCESFF